MPRCTESSSSTRDDGRLLCWPVLLSNGPRPSEFCPSDAERRVLSWGSRPWQAVMRPVRGGAFFVDATAPIVRVDRFLRLESVLVRSPVAGSRTRSSLAGSRCRTRAWLVGRVNLRPRDGMRCVRRGARTLGRTSMHFVRDASAGAQCRQREAAVRVLERANGPLSVYDISRGIRRDLNLDVASHRSMWLWHRTVGSAGPDEDLYGLYRHGLFPGPRNLTGVARLFLYASECPLSVDALRFAMQQAGYRLTVSHSTACWSVIVWLVGHRRAIGSSKGTQCQAPTDRRRDG